MHNNNEQNQYRIVSYKKPRNDKCKTIQTSKLTAHKHFFYVYNGFIQLLHNMNGS